MSIKHRLAEVDAGVRLAGVAAILAMWVNLVAVAGWLADDVPLQSFGVFQHPAQLVVTLSHILLSGALLCGVVGKLALVRMIALIPAAAALVGLLLWIGTDIGERELLAFGMRSTGASAYDVRPGAVNATTILLLSLALFAGVSQQRRSEQASALVTNLALGLTILSFGHFLFTEGRSGVADFAWSSSVPSVLSSLLICFGNLAWLSGRRFVPELDNSISHRLSVLSFTVILVSPSMVSLMEIALEEHGIMSSAMAELMAASLTIATVGLLLFWASGRIMRERSIVSTVLRALDTTPVALTDADGTILRWSEGCERLYGWSAEEAVGRSKVELLRSRAIAAAPSDGAQSQMLVEERRDGAELRVVEDKQTIVGAESEVVAALAMTDVTALVEAQEALREAQTRLALAIEAHSVGIFEWDVANDRISWSPGSEQRLGLRPGSIYSFETWQALVDPKDARAITETLAGVVAGREPHFSFHYHFRHPNGTSRAIEGSAACFYDEHGALEKTVGVNIDVSEREDREAQLLARESELSSILESVPDAVIVIDQEGSIQRFSSAAERIFGYTEADLLGSSYLQLAPDDLRAHFEALLSRAISQERPSAMSLLTAAKRADGQPIPVEVRSSKAVTGDEKRITLFIRDVTERLNSERRLSELSAELMHASRLSAMGEMAAGLAHELNQPLGATVNFITAAELLVTSEGADPKRVQDLLQMARGEAMRTAEIIRRLRSFVTKGDVMLSPEPIEEVVTEAVGLVAAGYIQSDVKISYRFETEGHSALIDRVQIQQVLVNLLRNSIEALSANPADQRCIDIATRALPEMIEISVCDNGPGLPQDALEQPFRAFVSTKAEGMGVGLSICRRIVEAHGGEFRFENRLEGGARFTFTVAEATGQELMES